MSNITRIDKRNVDSLESSSSQSIDIKDSILQNLSKSELLSHGCRNCIWKLHTMCPHGITGTDKYGEGICQDFMEFLISLTSDGDTVNAMWEKYNLYVLRLQALEDYKEFQELGQELKLMQDTGEDTRDTESRYNSYKLWWTKLNDQVLRTLGRVVDREQRSNLGAKPKMTVQQMNVMINESSKKLLELENKKDDG